MKQRIIRVAEVAEEQSDKENAGGPQADAFNADVTEEITDDSYKEDDKKRIAAAGYENICK